MIYYLCFVRLIWTFGTMRTLSAARCRARPKLADYTWPAKISLKNNAPVKMMQFFSNSKNEISYQRQLYLDLYYDKI